MNIKIENNSKIYPSLSIYDFNLKDCIETPSASFLFNGQYEINSLTSKDVINDLDDSCLYEQYSQSTGLTLTQVSGDVFCFDIDGTYFNGGFYQGVYKLHKYPYQVLPQCFDDGFALEFMLTQSGESCSVSLNDVFENNDGFIFYMGLQKENPYLATSGNVISCDGVRYNDTISDDTAYPWDEQNPFLVYTESFTCSGITIDYDLKIKYDYSDIINNAFGVRITSDGKINIRYIIKSVENNYEIVNLYSESVIPYGQPTHLVLNFQQLINYNTCTDEDKVMNLYVWVNGFMVQKFCIPNILFKGLNMQKEHQIGIPYNISIGGGTLGLLYDTLHTAQKTLCEYDLCVSLYSQNITEYSYDGNVYYVDIPVSEIEKFVQDNFDKDFKAYLTSKNKKYIYKGTIKTTKRIDYIKFGISCISSVTPLNCKDVTIQNDNVLTQNYAGTFIGNIYCFNFYNSYLTVQDIRHKLATNCIGVSYENCYRC